MGFTNDRDGSRGRDPQRPGHGPANVALLALSWHSRKYAPANTLSCAFHIYEIIKHT